MFEYYIVENEGLQEHIIINTNDKSIEEYCDLYNFKIIREIDKDEYYLNSKL